MSVAAPITPTAAAAPTPVPAAPDEPKGAAPERLTAKRLVSGAAWRGIETAGGELISFGVFLGLARILSPESFGIVALAGSILTLMQSVLYSGFTEALVQKDALRPQHLAAVQAACTLLALAMIAGGTLLAWPLGMLLGRDEFAALFIALLPTLLLRAQMSAMLAAMRRQFTFRAIALRTLAAVVCGGLVAILLARHGAGKWALVAQQWTGEVVGFVILSACSQAKPWHTAWNREALREILPVAMPVLWASLFTHASRRLDTFVLGLFLVDHEVGAWFLVARLVVAAQMVTQHGMNEVALVVLSRLQRDAGQQERIVTTLLLVTLASCLAFGNLAVAGPWLIGPVFGQAWVDAAPALRIYAAASAAGSFVATAGIALISEGSARRFGRLTVLAALLQLGAAAVCAHWGLVAVAWGNACAQAIALCAALWVLCADPRMPARRLIGLVALLLITDGVAIAAGLAVAPLAGGHPVQSALLASLAFTVVLALGATPLLLPRLRRSGATAIHEHAIHRPTPSRSGT